MFANNICKKCGNKFHFNIKCCGYDPEHEYLMFGYCSENCYILHDRFNNDLVEALKDEEYLRLYLNEAIELYKKDEDIDLFMYTVKPILKII